MSTKAKTRGIICTADEARGLADGTIGEIRRVMEPQPGEEAFEGPYWYEPGVVGKGGELEPGTPVFGISALDGEWGVKCPYPPGTELYVREAWRMSSHESGEGCPCYRADNTCLCGRKAMVAVDDPILLWRSSAVMPRWAARTWLRVTSVRAEWSCDKVVWVYEVEQIETPEGGE